MTVTLRSAQRPELAKSVTAYSGIANGDVVTADGSGVVASVGARPLGIVVGDIPTTNPPNRFPLAVSGDVIYDDALVSQTDGATVYSDGDGTYSTTEPNAGVGAVRWEIGFIRDSDANGTTIELAFQATEDADA